jgi:Xaa-Pro aminopeptidase
MGITHGFDTRTEQFQKMLGEQGIDAAILLEPRDQFYLTGIGVKGAVIVPVNDEPVHLVQLDIERAQKDSSIYDVRPSKGIKTIIDVIISFLNEKSQRSVLRRTSYLFKHMRNSKRHFCRKQYWSTSVPQYSVFANESQNQNLTE